MGDKKYFHRETNLNYSLISISGSVNDGNRLIEYALLALLNLPMPTITVSMFKLPEEEEIDRINQTDFCLLPGSTILAKNAGDSLAMSVLFRIKVPKLCVGASVWEPRYPAYIEILEHITPPIGCRDPHTLKIIQDLGFTGILTGCPTASNILLTWRFLPSWIVTSARVWPTSLASTRTVDGLVILPSIWTPPSRLRTSASLSSPSASTR